MAGADPQAADRDDGKSDPDRANPRWKVRDIGRPAADAVDDHNARLIPADRVPFASSRSSFVEAAGLIVGLLLLFAVVAVTGWFYVAKRRP